MIIGVTGGIGSGKSTVLQAVAKLGYPVYDCDTEAKRIITEDREVRRQMIALFGENVYLDGIYQTRRVAEEVFGKPQLLKQLNGIVHPMVSDDLKRWVAEKPLAFVESAILFEAGLDKICDGLCIVTAPETIRIERVVNRALQNRQTLHTDDVRQRIQAQQDDIPFARKTGKPLLILDNDGQTNIKDLTRQLLNFSNSL